MLTFLTVVYYADFNDYAECADCAEYANFADYCDYADLWDADLRAVWTPWHRLPEITKIYKMDKKKTPCHVH